MSPTDSRLSLFVSFPCIYNSEVGGAISEYYDNCKPKLQDYDVNVRVYIVGPNVILGTQLNVVDLSKRHFLEFRNAVTIKVSLPLPPSPTLVPTRTYHLEAHSSGPFHTFFCRQISLTPCFAARISKKVTMW